MGEPCRAASHLRDKMREDDAADRRAQEFQRVYDELFANNERDWGSWREYLTPAERDDMQDAIMHECHRDNEPLTGYDRFGCIEDVIRRYCKRAIEAWAEKEMPPEIPEPREFYVDHDDPDHDPEYCIVCRELLAFVG